ncbi:MAG: hypothetical protein ACOY93_08465 [Bacillota bacterium]
MGMSILLREYEGNLFSGWLDMEKVDEEASLHRFYAELERRLQAEWPDAEIRIERQARTIGPTPDPIVSGDDLSAAEERDIIDRIHRIGEVLYEESESWLVERGAE